LDWLCVLRFVKNYIHSIYCVVVAIVGDVGAAVVVVVVLEVAVVIGNVAVVVDMLYTVVDVVVDVTVVVSQSQLHPQQQQRQLC